MYGERTCFCRSRWSGAEDRAAQAVEGSIPGPQDFTRAKTGRDVAGTVANRPAEAVCPEAELPPDEHRHGPDLFGIHGGQPANRRRVPRGDSRVGVGRQLLLLPGFRGQHAGDLQTYRMGARQAATPARRREPSRRAFTRFTRRCISATEPSGRSCSGPASSARRDCTSLLPTTSMAVESFGPEAYERFETFLKARGSFNHDLRCYDDALDFIAEVRDRAALSARIDKAFPSGIESAAFAHLLKVPLYPYQREGALFAARAGRSLHRG